MPSRLVTRAAELLFGFLFQVSLFHDVGRPEPFFFSTLPAFSDYQSIFTHAQLCLLFARASGRGFLQFLAFLGGKGRHSLLPPTHNCFYCFLSVAVQQWWRGVHCGASFSWLWQPRPPLHQREPADFCSSVWKFSILNLDLIEAASIYI